MVFKEIKTVPGEQAFSRKVTLVWALATVALLAVGAPFLLERLTDGLAVADTTNRVPWGLWVVAYTWFSGLAGGLFLVSSLSYLFRVERFAPVARLALVGSVVFLVASALLIGLDLGALGNAGGALLFFRWSSALSWEIKLYLVFLLIVAIQLALVLRGDSAHEEQRGNRNLAIRILAGLGVALSFVGPPSGTGMLFAAVKARDFWNDGITTVLFYAAAIVTAAGFLLVVYVLLARLRHVTPERKTVKGLAWVLLTALIVSACAAYFQLVTSVLPDGSQGGQAAQIVLFGSLAPLFWVGAAGIGFVASVALAVAAVRSGRSAYAVTAGLSAMVGVFSLRYAFVTVGFLVPLLAGLPAASYVPNVAEIAVVVFAFGLAGGLFGLAVRFLALETAGASEGRPQVASSCAKRPVREGAAE